MVGNGNGHTKIKSTWLIPLISAALAVVIAVAILSVQWQTTLSATTQNDKDITNLISHHGDDIDKLVFDHETDIARLDESNRNRRNQIADLEERIAILEERTSG